MARARGTRISRSDARCRRSAGTRRSARYRVVLSTGLLPVARLTEGIDVAGRIVHLVRHGEVENPDGVLYGRMPGFHLSDRGRKMAMLAAEELAARDQDSGVQRISRVICSPLERAVESAEPIARLLGLEIETDARIIEAESYLEGGQFEMSLSILAKPAAWRFLVNPLRPSWGEPFAEVSDRVDSLLREVSAGDGGATVLVSHQLPIWIAHRRAVGHRLAHDPRKRRCALSSITTLESASRGFSEIGYREPAQSLLGGAVDVGAV
ncbi:MAG TPA: histidine phosphatase family protein [Cryobacterium sp.]|nr:histidine phosphatase family protein [Cryobacterium sp.]